MRAANEYHSSERDQCHHLFHQLIPFEVYFHNDARLESLLWGVYPKIREGKREVCRRKQTLPFESA